MSRPNKTSEQPVLGWDENDPFIIDALLDKDNKIDEKNFKLLRKMHNEFTEVTKEGDLVHFSANKIPYRYKMLKLRNKNHLPIPIPLREDDFKRVPKLQKRLEMQDGEDSVNVDYIIFDNQFKKEVKNDSLRDRLLVIKTHLQSRSINVKAVET